MTGSEHLTDDGVLDAALATLRGCVYLGDTATISDLRERTGLDLMEQQEVRAALMRAGLIPTATRKIREPGQVKRVERCLAVLEQAGWVDRKASP